MRPMTILQNKLHSVAELAYRYRARSLRDKDATYTGTKKCWRGTQTKDCNLAYRTISIPAKEWQRVA
jgi:hypothetical protein